MLLCGSGDACFPRSGVSDLLAWRGPSPESLVTGSPTEVPSVALHLRDRLQPVPSDSYTASRVFGVSADAESTPGVFTVP